MSHATTTNIEVPRVAESARGRGTMIMIAGAVLTGLAVILGFTKGDHFRHFSFAYLVGASWVLALGLGGLFFCVLQHLTKAGWSVAVRRIAEMAAASLKLSAVLFLPLLLPAVMGYSELWWWLDHAAAHKDHLVHAKTGFLNPPFFIVRAVIYFTVWILMARFFVKNSLEQDETGDPALTTKMQTASGPLMVVFALTTTFAAFDFLMSLDPHWFSTIFGVYFFAGCALSLFSLIALSVCLMRAKLPGYAKLVTPEHTHDVGKFMFGFTFFWGYIAFSQYMLIWYANVPEETIWFEHRGANTDFTNAWTPWTLVLLFGHFLIPFPGLLSRHVKRNPKVLATWACWILVMQLLDMFWLIRPEMRGHGGHGEMHVDFHPLDIVTPVGLILIAAGYWLRWIAGRPALPQKDPRLGESLALVNQ
ncbi:MAG: quinol:cytochrome C oxidoreductase [Planctomycetota bacterium]